MNAMERMCWRCGIFPAALLAAATLCFGCQLVLAGVKVEPGAPPSQADTLQAARLHLEGQMLSAQGRWPEAIRALAEAVRIGPYDESLRYELGKVMQEHATPREMAAYWMADVVTDPKPQTGYYFWAVGLERAGNLDGAAEKLAQALVVDPAHEMSENRLGVILEKQGRLPEALAHYRMATEILPTFQEAQQNCVRLLLQLGRTSEAAEQLARARAAASGKTRPAVYWARFLLARGRTKAALAEVERALRENPNDAEARELMLSVRSALSEP